MSETPSSSRRFPRQFRLRAIFVLTAAVAGVLGWIAYQRQISQERYSAGYAMGFVSRVVRPKGGVADFGDLSVQSGDDVGTSEAKRLCAEQQNLPTDLNKRVQLFLKLVQSEQHVPPDVRTRIIRRLRHMSRLSRDYDNTDVYDRIAGSGVGFWCRRCRATFGTGTGHSEKDAIMSYHEQGQTAKRLGWLVQETEDRIHVLCSKCRHSSGEGECNAQH